MGIRLQVPTKQIHSGLEMYSAPQNRQAGTRNLFHDGKLFYCDQFTERAVTYNKGIRQPEYKIPIFSSIVFYARGTETDIQGRG
jgi:hypothetical protein